MNKFPFNTIQLDVNQDQFLFYHPDGERYGLCDLRTLSSSSTKFKGVRLHTMNEEAIDERIKTFNINQAELGIEISSKKENQIEEKKELKIEEDWNYFRQYVVQSILVSFILISDKLEKISYWNRLHLLGITQFLVESTTTTNKIFEGKQQSAEDSIPMILEIDRCTSMNDGNDEEDEEEEEKETSEQDKVVKPSVISLSSITTQQSDLKKECFEKSLIEELRSINNKLDSIKKRFNRVENLSTVIYEMASERRVIHSLCSLGMTSIDGLSSEFYYVHEYQTALISLARELNNNYRHRWACYNHYVDISLSLLKR
ncbi:unnamed protein product [Rotaria magnacalcarata]